MRRQRQPCTVDKRRIRKMVKFLRVQLLRSSRNFRISLFIAALTAAVLFLLTSSNRNSRSHSLFLETKSSLLMQTHSPEDIVLQETTLSLRHICDRKELDNNVDELHFCGSFKSHAGKKIVGLVEVRNVARSITPFLSALGEVVDSIVVLDDHSTDASRLRILQHSSITGNGKPVVEVLLNKTGEWVREELFDRELLLVTARKIGGTHFVLLDYDEYLSANCVENGLLRQTILQLAPGESLNLPWIELWKSHTMQRVLPDDPGMNFLTRRQTVIFADDGTSHYTRESATARFLGSHSRNSTIHVLRCPRSICPKPPRYHGPGSDFGEDKRVKQLAQCAIIEMRFLNLNNVLLKSAWYEALGRLTGADEGVTSGKMINLLFPNRRIPSDKGYRVEVVNPELLGKHALAGAKSLEDVEMWRAEELLRWMDFRGKSAFADLHSLTLINVDELRNVLQQARSDAGDTTCHVPRRKNGTLVVVYETSVGGVAGRLLAQIGFTEIELEQDLWDRYPEGVRFGTFEKGGPQHERWIIAVKRKIHSTLQESSTSKTFLSLPRRGDPLCVMFMDLLRRELTHVNVVILATALTSSLDEDKVSIKAKTFAQEMGSHIQFINVPIENFGSYSALYWMANRLNIGADKSNHTSAEWGTLLDFAETIHSENRRDQQNLAFPRYAPVAKLVFSLNFGRSGSKYLADLIGTTRGLVFSQHEPSCPDRGCSSGGALPMQNKSLTESYEERKMLKLPMIRKAITNISRMGEGDLFVSRTTDCDLSNTMTKMDNHRSSSDVHDGLRQTAVFEINSHSGCVVHVLRNAVYAETNPNFKSWIYDVSLDYFPHAGYDVRVVVLRKYVAALLKSLYETGYFTVRDGYNWMETLASVNSKQKVQSLQNDNRLDGYGKILSYLINSEALFRHVLQLYKHRKDAPLFLEMRSERLYSVEGTMEVLDWLGLEPTERTSSLAGSVRDKYLEGTSKRRKSVSLTESEERVKQFLDKVRDDSDAGLIRDLLRPLDKLANYEYPP